MIGCAESRSERYFVVPTTPTTSIGALHPLPSSLANRRPTAAGVPKNFVAIASFTIATCGDVFVSRSSKSLPARMGIPSVAKYPSLTALAHAIASSSDAGLKPSVLTTSFHVEPPIGVI